MRPLSLFIVFFAITNFSCEEKKPEPWTALNYRRIADSLNIGNIIASYAESENLLMLEYDTMQKQYARRITYRKGYPLHIDTLFCITERKFYSKLVSTSYEVKDTCVLTVHHVKIFHPNSNLKGQGPWIQPYVNTYKRLDN